MLNEAIMTEMTKTCESKQKFGSLMKREKVNLKKNTEDGEKVFFLKFNIA